MTRLHENIVGIDAAIFMHPTTWKASGHVDAFNDPLIDNKDSKRRYRADVLLEDYIGKIEAKSNKEVEKAKAKFGDAFDEEKFRATNPNVVRNTEKISGVEARMKSALENSDLAALKQLIEDCEIADPDTGSRNWTEVRQFNLMFSDRIGFSCWRCCYHLPQARNCTRNFCQFPQCSKEQQDENSVWYCTDRKSIQKRNYCPSIHSLE